MIETMPGVDVESRPVTGRMLKISWGNNRFATKWSNKEISFDELRERLKATIRTSETVAEYQKMPKSERDTIKDVGGYVLGHLRGGARKKNMVECRSALTFDADSGDAAFLARIMAFPHQGIIYSTHGHTPEAPRIRQILPLSRDITADEYSCVARLVANELGMDAYDDSTYEPSRLMYLPSTPQDGEYICCVLEGSPINPDEYLCRLSDWHDCSIWPTSSRQSAVIERNVQEQADPLAKSGIIGAFCRSYSVEDAISTFLSDVYEPTLTGRYTYMPGSTAGGVVIYGDGRWAYSHHGTDPASGKLLNAFDLVRIHKFSELDEKDSSKAMMDFAALDEKVRGLITKEKLESARDDFKVAGDWMKQLERERGSMVLKNKISNLLLILENDPRLNAIVFNQLADGMEITDEVPWKHPARFWRDADDSQLVCYIDTHYGTFSSANYKNAVSKIVDDRSFHPIHDYLQSLPPWDGAPRVETLLVDYLGAEDTPYNRAVTRKTLFMTGNSTRWRMCWRRRTVSQCW
ncbi:hypothetical protein AGMMS49992_28130 [Clostridia bacterium]|nr:hypothetical protein AGMMS49992_28130 [Clostridia bacterium]